MTNSSIRDMFRWTVAKSPKLIILILLSSILFTLFILMLPDYYSIVNLLPISSSYDDASKQSFIYAMAYTISLFFALVINAILNISIAKTYLYNASNGNDDDLLRRNIRKIKYFEISKVVCYIFTFLTLYFFASLAVKCISFISEELKYNEIYNDIFTILVMGLFIITTILAPLLSTVYKIGIFLVRNREGHSKKNSNIHVIKTLVKQAVVSFVAILTIVGLSYICTEDPFYIRDVQYTIYQMIHIVKGWPIVVILLFRVVYTMIYPYDYFIIEEPGRV